MPNSSETPTIPSQLSSTMPKTPKLTLILAATPSLGIGKAGDLPWPKLKKEMGYFARVTKRTNTPTTNGPRKLNAVLMGRKTWDSIPPKFRPLKDRLNIVITRSPEDLKKSLQSEQPATAVEGPLIASGIIDALSQLSNPQGSSPLADPNIKIEHVFVIGGASVYQTALELPQTTRVLLTRINKEYECDTFFPLNLEETKTWRRCSREEVQSVTGEEIKEGGEEEAGVGFEFCLFERVRD